MKNLRKRSFFSIMSAGLAVVLISLVFSTKAKAANDAEIIRGFKLTVFGAEYGVSSRIIRKFAKPVRVKIHNLSEKNRTGQVSKFIQSLNRSVNGLKIRVSNSDPNFNVYVVDQKDYVSTARKYVYKRRTAPVRGDCLVRSTYSFRGILRTDALIVSDRGEVKFKGCMVEEILQGLGPINDHGSLRESIFNDNTNFTKLTRFDRTIMNMLYDPSIKAGSTLRSIEAKLPLILKNAKQR